MAKQHFYSRVPARISAFNRTDSFDTFAYSEGLERELIEKDLAAVYNNPPSKNDAALIRNGKLKPLYCHYFTKAGMLVQSCMSFQPLDYTGERSTFLSHILLPDADEEQAILNNPDNALLNPDMFVTNLNGFSLTDPNAVPITDYPEKPYKAVPAESTESLTKYDSAMMKRLIFSLLNLACGKGKTAFISLPFGQADYSRKALQFINTLLQIFPYHLRRYFSFVTYTDDPSRFSSFNIRFIPEGTAEIPTSKGITMHFGPKITLGLSDDVVASSSQLVEFFYSLLKNDEVRRAFLSYMQGVVETAPELRKTSLKTLTELVFIFQECSGFFSEKVVLPTDTRVFDFICAYEKHRHALNEDYHAVAMRCLFRYPNGHVAIPKDVFSRMVKLYPTEPVVSRRVINEVVLRLIHTDLMREKLFAFIKNNYENEEPEVKALICESLCRVYYGGFLQLPILTFFQQIFSGEPEETKDQIIEKLLLTIRTKAVQNGIVEFFSSNYNTLTESQKDRLYATCFEMIPECDELSSELIRLIDRHILAESPDKIRSAEEKLYRLTEANLKRNDPMLLPMLLQTAGFCCDAVTNEIFSQHSGSRVFGHYVQAFWQLPFERKLALSEEIWIAVPSMTVETAEAFGKAVCQMGKECPEAVDLYGFILADQTVSPHLNGTDAEKAFASCVLEEYIRPQLLQHFPEAFSVKKKRDGLSQVVAYAADKPYLLYAPEYHNVGAFAKLCEAAKKSDLSGMASAATVFDDKPIRVGAAEHLKMQLLNGTALAEEKYEPSRLMTQVLIGYILKQELSFFDPYTSMISTAADRLCVNDPKLGRESAEQEAARISVGYTLKVVEQLYLLPEYAELFTTMFCEQSPLYTVLSDFSNRQRKATRWIDEYMTYNKFNEKFSTEVLTLLGGIKPTGGGLFKRLFG